MLGCRILKGIQSVFISSLTGARSTTMHRNVSAIVPNPGKAIKDERFRRWYASYGGGFNYFADPVAVKTLGASGLSVDYVER